MSAFILHQIADQAAGRFILPQYKAEKYFVGLKHRTLTFDDGYLGALSFLAAHSEIMADNRVILFIASEAVGARNFWDDDGELSGQELADWSLLRHLREAGCVIGSHGRFHNDLRALSDADLREELTVSKKVLEDNLGCSVDSFAYPYGLYDQRVIEFVKAAGYGEAFTTCGSVLQGRGNPFRRPRLEIRGTDSDLVVRLKLCGFYDAASMGELPRLLWERWR